mmetsp:Transcript_22056/g.62655  ORF Transcript_22056/g.62655 Transcript_22056/m.62655 type:complete len:239 (-) Transcript_22056:527-1243(-)
MPKCQADLRMKKAMLRKSDTYMSIGMGSSPRCSDDGPGLSPKADASQMNQSTCVSFQFGEVCLVHPQLAVPVEIYPSITVIVNFLGDSDIAWMQLHRALINRSKSRKNCDIAANGWRSAKQALPPRCLSRGLLLGKELTPVCGLGLDDTGRRYDVSRAQDVMSEPITIRRAQQHVPVLGDLRIGAALESEFPARLGRRKGNVHLVSNPAVLLHDLPDERARVELVEHVQVGDLPSLRE